MTPAQHAAAWQRAAENFAGYEEAWSGSSLAGEATAHRRLCEAVAQGYREQVNEEGAMAKSTRAEVYVVIDGERAYQDAGRGNAARHGGAPVPMPVGEYLLYMEKCLHDAREACYRGSTGSVEAMPFVRKVAALAVGCMEHHGAYLR